MIGFKPGQVFACEGALWRVESATAKQFKASMLRGYTRSAAFRISDGRLLGDSCGIAKHARTDHGHVRHAARNAARQRYFGPVVHQYREVMRAAGLANNHVKADFLTFPQMRTIRRALRAIVETARKEEVLKTEGK